MNYNKPEISLLGKAGEVIADVNHNPKQLSSGDNGKPINPAYDLDE